MLRWILAFADRPAAAFDDAARFWTAVTDTRLSARRGTDGEFATFLPAGGDACLKLQGVRDGGGVHLDLEFHDPAAAIQTAQDLGATVVRHHGHWAVMASPTGMPFCALPWTGAATRPAAVTHADGAASRVDQVCLDIAPEAFDTETAFWAALADGTARPARFPEFAWLDGPDGLPIRILFQRTDTSGHPTTAHLDLACTDPAAIRALHERHGARFVAEGKTWLVMRDPAGGVYCLTGRDPQTGRLPAA
jgi:hypothetical protein